MNVIRQRCKTGSSHQSNCWVEKLTSSQIYKKNCQRACQSTGHADGQDVLSENRLGDGCWHKRPVWLAGPARLEEIGNVPTEYTSCFTANRGFIPRPGI